MTLLVEHLTSRPVGESAVEDVSFEIASGEFVTIVGPNGAGKTTLCRCLAGLLAPNAGVIRVNGVPLTGGPWFAARAGLALVPKGRRVFPELTVRENLLSTLLLDRARGATRLDDVYSLFPALKDRERQIAGSMSGGEQQTVAIARALLSGPSFIVLDEPSLGLSPQAIDTVYTGLRDVARRGMGVLVTDESARRAAWASRVLSMESGRLAAP